MLHDNARPHAAHVTRDTLRRFGLGVVDHPRVTVTCFGPWRRLWRAGGSWGSGTVVHPATLVLLCGGYNESCAALGQVPKQWWSVPVACLVLSSAYCHCGIVVVVKYILYTFLVPCPCFTWTTPIIKEFLRPLISVFYTKDGTFSFKHLLNCPDEAEWTPFQTPLLPRISGKTENRTRDPWIRSQKLWPLDHKGHYWE
jgi:hypothetical protein